MPVRAIDQEIAALAAAQFGVVERSQLRALGVTDAGVARRIAAGVFIGCAARCTRSGIPS